MPQPSGNPTACKQLNQSRQREPNRRPRPDASRRILFRRRIYRRRADAESQNAKSQTK